MSFLLSLAETLALQHQLGIEKTHLIKCIENVKCI